MSLHTTLRGGWQLRGKAKAAAEGLSPLASSTAGGGSHLAGSLERGEIRAAPPVFAASPSLDSVRLAGLGVRRADSALDAEAGAESA